MNLKKQANRKHEIDIYRQIKMAPGITTRNHLYFFAVFIFCFIFLILMLRFQKALLLKPGSLRFR